MGLSLGSFKQGRDGRHGLSPPPLSRRVVGAAHSQLNATTKMRRPRTRSCCGSSRRCSRSRWGAAPTPGSASSSGGTRSRTRCRGSRRRSRCSSSSTGSAGPSPSPPADPLSGQVGLVSRRGPARLRPARSSRRRTGTPTRPTRWPACSRPSSARNRARGQGVVLVCHSMGCGLGARIARRGGSPLSRHVLGLVAICPVAWSPGGEMEGQLKTLLRIPPFVFDPGAPGTAAAAPTARACGGSWATAPTARPSCCSTATTARARRLSSAHGQRHHPSTAGRVGPQGGNRRSSRPRGRGPSSTSPCV